jgi:hypothetical protein
MLLLLLDADIGVVPRDGVSLEGVRLSEEGTLLVLLSTSIALAVLGAFLLLLLLTSIVLAASGAFLWLLLLFSVVLAPSDALLPSVVDAVAGLSMIVSSPRRLHFVLVAHVVVDSLIFILL